MDREDVLLAFRALKAGYPPGDLKKAVRKQNSLPVRKPLVEVLRSELRVAEAVIEPFRSSSARPDPRADRAILDQISKIVVDEGALTASEFEKLAGAVAAAQASTIHPPMEVPMKLGDYEIRWEVRRDAHSAVYHGWHPAHGDVALKIFRRGSAPENLRVRYSERHPGIVRMIEVAEAESFRFVVMELVEGQPLSKLVRAKKLTAREALVLAERAGRTLADLHEQGHFHGSLRGSDLFVDKDQVRIKDFAGVEGTAAGDLRAYAEILYECAAGVPPYGPGDPHDRPPPSAGTINKALDPEADRLVTAAMEGRYGTMRTLVDDLGRLLRGEMLALPKPAGSNRRVAVVAAVLFLLIAGAAAVAFAVAKSRKPSAPAAAPKPDEPKPEKRDEKSREDPTGRKEEPRREAPRREESDPEGPMSSSEEVELRGRCYELSRTDLDELGRVAERAIRRGPKSAWSHYYFAVFLKSKGRVAEALVHADESVRLEPDSRLNADQRFELLLLAGEVHRSLDETRTRYGKEFKKLNDRIKALDAELVGHPGDGAKFLERGVLWAHRPDLERAEADFSSAIDRGQRPALHFRARIRERLRKYREALDDVGRFLHECPDLPAKGEATALRADLENRMR